MKPDARLFRLSLYLLAASALLRLCCGCALPYHTEWSRGSGLTDRQWAVVGEAARQWCEATEGACCPAVAEYETARQVRESPLLEARRLTGISSPLGWYADCAPAAEEKGGCSPLIGIVVKRLKNHPFEAIILHEFGHYCAPGARHSYDPQAVMYGTMKDRIVLTSADIAWYRQFQTGDR